MNPDLDALATRLYVTVDDLLIDHPEWAPQRPAIGIAPQLSDAELITLAVIQATLPPAMHPVIGHLPQRTHPRVRVAAGNRVVDDLEDQLLRLSADARGDRAGQAN